MDFERETACGAELNRRHMAIDELFSSPLRIRRKLKCMDSRFIFLVCCALALLSAALFWRYIPGTIQRDANGFVHGTGKLEYFYPNGKLRLAETYQNGQIRRSKFYRPDGTVFATTDWQNGTSLEYGLNDDGSLHVVIPYRNGLAEGWATEYGVDRTVSRCILYRNGQKIYP